MELKMVRRLSGFGGMLAGLVMQSSVARAGEVIGWMDVRPADGQIEIAGHAYSAARVAVDYTLKVDRAGPSGRTSTSQRGHAEIEPGEVARLSTTSVNLGAKDALTVVLTLSNSGRTLATSEIHLGGR
jgi:hypothetical protein